MSEGAPVETPGSRQGLSWPLPLLALVVLFGVGSLWRSAGAWQQNDSRRKHHHTQTLSLVVAHHQRELEVVADMLLRELEQGSALGRAERSHRRSLPLFDSWYLFEEGGLRWPVAEAVDDTTVLASDPCLSRARALASLGRQSEAATAYAACVEQPEPVGLIGLHLAVQLLESTGRGEEILPLLRRGSRGLAHPQEADADPYLMRRAALRMLVAERAPELIGHGLEVEAEELLQSPSPSLVLLWPTLRKMPTGAGSPLVSGLMEAEDRIALWRWVKERLGPLRAQCGEQLTAVSLSEGHLGLCRRQPSGRTTLVALNRARWEEGLLARVREELQAEGVRLVGGQAYADAGLHIAVPVGRLDPLVWVSMAEPNDEAGATWRDWLLPQIAALALSLVLASALLVVHHRARQRHALLMQRQQDFITRVTHELKTPLAGIRLMAENLQMGAISDPPTARQFLGRILAEASNLGQRIDEVLKVARDRRPSQLVPLRLDELAAEVVAQWQPRFQQKAGELRADLRPCALTRADPELLRDALSNLLDNALKYGREGFRTECVVRTTEMGRWVVLDVSDNGMGVPADMRRAIFERFTRVERSGRGKSGGHGLGLAFVAETVAALRGTVDCFEGTEGGARFRIKLRKM